MWPEQPSEEDDKPRGYKPGLVMVLITLLLILAMLATLVWPLLQIRHRQPPTPTLGAVAVRGADHAARGARPAESGR